MSPSVRSFRRPAVTVVGHVCIDENSGTGLSTAGRRSPGSPAVFMHRYLRWTDGARGLNVIAPYGTDFLELDPELPLANKPTAEGTLVYRNVLEGKARRQECFNTELAEPVAIDGRLAQVLAGSQLVLVCPLLPNLTPEYIGSVLDRTDAVTVLLAQGGFRSISATGRVARGVFADYEQVIPRFDIVVFSDEDTSDALGTARSWSAEFPGTLVVVTQNSEGATYFDRGAAVHVPATPLTTTGSGNVIGTGDVFGVALGLAQLETRDIRSAVEAANAAAARYIDTARSDEWAGSALTRAG